MNSPASQKLPEASAVAIYTKQAIAQMIQPVMLLTFLKFIQSYGLVLNPLHFLKTGKNREAAKLKGKELEL